MSKSVCRVVLGTPPRSIELYLEIPDIEIINIPASKDKWTADSRSVGVNYIRNSLASWLGLQYDLSEDDWICVEVKDLRDHPYYGPGVGEPGWELWYTGTLIKIN